MKLILCYLEIFLMIFFHIADATVLCKDRYSWCNRQANLCRLDVMKKLCRKTCGCSDNTQNNACFTLGCEYGCASDVSERIRCKCPTGYKLNDDEKTCSDIDECTASERDPCDYDHRLVCQNNFGSYVCIACNILPEYQNYYESNTCCRKTNQTIACGRNSATGVNIPTAKDKTLGLWPWTVLIEYNGERICSGVLISNQWILAAAHCFSATTNQTFLHARLSIRSTNDKDRNEHSMEAKINQLIIHEQFIFPHNDIALLHLDTTVSTSWAARPVALPNGEIPEQDTKCWISGYEAFYSQPEIIYGLVDSGITISKREVCNEKLGGAIVTVDTGKLLCGRYEASEPPVCAGESSGPIVCQRRESCQWYVAGIMAIGDMCSSKPESSQQAHTGMLSVGFYERWIEQNTGIIVGRDTC